MFRHTPETVQPLVDFANERHAITIRKAMRDATPLPSWANPMRVASIASWPGQETGHLTDDPIFQQYRFCSVFRELDRVTVWIRENIREPFADHEHLWFMLAIARFVNWPPTLNFLMKAKAWPDNPVFSPDLMTAALEDWKLAGNKVETGAYMIRAESDPNKEWYSWTKQRYVSEIVLGLPWAERKWASVMLEMPAMKLQGAWEIFRAANEARWTGWGPFMCGQVIADLRHTRYLRDAPDVGRWAPLGPGSTRGLNRLAGRPLKQAVNQEQGLDEMLQLQAIVNERTGPHVPPIELHDIQNCLCETDKYLRGKSRSLYVPWSGQ